MVMSVRVARKLLDDYRAIERRAAERRGALLDAAGEHLKFDALRIAPMTLLENAFSDVLHGLFDPRGVHRLRSSVLCEVLRGMLAAPISREGKKTVGKVLAAIESSEDLYRVTREHTIPESRLDVLVAGRTFLIGVEVKCAGGAETYLAKKSQTERHARGLLDLAEKRRIRRDCVLMIFLSPGGGAAQSRHFIPLSAETLVGSLSKFASSRTVEWRSLDAILHLYRRK